MSRLLNLAVHRLISHPTSVFKVVSPSAWRSLIATANDTGGKQRKVEARRSAFFDGNWKHGTVSKRNYASYEEYLVHQGSKLDDIETRLRGKEEKNQERFRQRFEKCPEFKGTILCLGARLGTEVKALHSLGHFAVGIDLNPGPENRYVVVGDFHHIQFPNNCIDVVYTNCMDHVYDVSRVLTEIRRILKPDGCFITDTLSGYEEGFIAGAYEATFWPKVRPFLESIAQDNNFQITRCEPAVDDPVWIQCVMKKK